VYTSQTVFYRSQQVIAPKTTEWTSDLLLSSGIRWANNFKNGFQIVPGSAVPFLSCLSRKWRTAFIRQDNGANV
jgi:hypothetical protein